jgi:hypothetical protein
MREAKLNRLAFEHAAKNPVPNSSWLQCPLCGEHLHVTLADDNRYPEVIAAEAETACWQHLSNRHRRRFWIYRETGWKWPVRGLVG